ncbi:NAD/NADP-dependent octopine/nopaline dehydrogenase family protein [Vallitalea sediminicola]
MNITIVGAGNGGTALAADLSLKDHKITLLKTSNKGHNEHFKNLINNFGKVVYEDSDGKHITKIHKVTTSFEEALVPESELIILFIQTNYHENVIKKMIPYLKDNQVILIEPGYLSTSYFMKHCGDLNLIIVEAESSPLDCRIVEAGKIKVLFKNIRNPVGIYPNSCKTKAMNILNQLDYNFIPLKSVVEAALHNPNLIVHTIGAIMSIPRIEHSKSDYWMYREVFTPSIWNLVEKLDCEKMEVLKSLGIEPLSYVEACKFRNSENLDLDAKEVFFEYAQNSSTSGPTVSNSRYITEDVPEGLVLLESLGELLNVSTPICSSLINIASACMKTNYREVGRNVDRLQLEKIIGTLSNEN